MVRGCWTLFSVVEEEAPRIRKYTPQHPSRKKRKCSSREAFDEDKLGCKWIFLGVDNMIFVSVPIDKYDKHALTISAHILVKCVINGNLRYPLPTCIYKYSWMTLFKKSFL